MQLLQISTFYVWNAGICLYSFNTNKFRSLESRDSKKNHNTHKNCLKSREHYSGKWDDSKESLLKIIGLAQNKEIISLKHIESSNSNS